MIKDFVSVVVPTCNRYEIALKNVENILRQSWSQKEVIVCDDSDKEEFLKHGKEFKNNLDKLKNTKYFYVARFDHEGKKDYGLARARNFGVIEAKGEFLVFLDDRITPANKEMISCFIRHLKKGRKLWCFGDKGAHKKSFVENCSAIRRSEMIDAGMFCERIDKYGGMSRELHYRYGHQGFKFVFCPDALAEQVSKSTGWDKKEQEIVEMKKLLEKMFVI